MEGGGEEAATATSVAHGMAKSLALLEQGPGVMACLPRKRRLDLAAASTLTVALAEEAPPERELASIWCRGCLPLSLRKGFIPYKMTNAFCARVLSRARARLWFQALRARSLPCPSRTRVALPAAANLALRSLLALCQTFPRAMAQSLALLEQGPRGKRRYQSSRLDQERGSRTACDLQEWTTNPRPLRLDGETKCRPQESHGSRPQESHKLPPQRVPQSPAHNDNLTTRPQKSHKLHHKNHTRFRPQESHKLPPI